MKVETHSLPPHAASAVSAIEGGLSGPNLLRRLYESIRLSRWSPNKVGSRVNSHCRWMVRQRQRDDERRILLEQSTSVGLG